jgi:hypothetical protein
MEKGTDYTLDGLEDRARAALLACRDYVEGLKLDYVRRWAWRRERDIPVLGFCGMGRAGKDTAAEYYCAVTDVVYPGPASSLILPLVAHVANDTPEHAWRVRHDHREFWIAACHAIRGKDYDMLVKMCLGAGDVAVGIRGRLEFEKCARDGVVDLLVWIDNPRVPADITVEYGPEDCDVVLPNHGSRRELYAKVYKLVEMLRKTCFKREED